MVLLISECLFFVHSVSLSWLSNKIGKNTGQFAPMSALLGHCTLSTQCQLR